MGLFVMGGDMTAEEVALGRTDARWNARVTAQDLCQAGSDVG